MKLSSWESEKIESKCIAPNNTCDNMISKNETTVTHIAS